MEANIISTFSQIRGPSSCHELLHAPPCVNAERGRSSLDTRSSGFRTVDFLLLSVRLEEIVSFSTGSGTNKAAMVPGVSGVVVLVICASMSISVFAHDCKSYRDLYNIYHMPKECEWGSFCCGTCKSRECCYVPFRKLTESAQEICDRNTASRGNLDSNEKFHKEFSSSTHVAVITSTVITAILFLLLLVCCCICPCCCIYKMCRRPQPVVATTTHTTVVTSAPQQYPQQPMSVPGQPQAYQATQYPPYQPMPVQPGYGTQPMAMPPYQGQAFTPGPPPPYQEAIGPAYPPTQPMPYSQAAYNPGQPAYPLHPPTHPQPNAPSSHADFLAQPAYNPDYVAPPTTG